MMEAEQYKNNLETLGCGCIVVIILVLEAGEISVRVLFQDNLMDIVPRSSERDMVRHATGHSRVQKSNQLALRIEDSCARVTFGREITMLSAPEVKNRNLPGLALGIPTGVCLELRLATKGKVGRLPHLGNGEVRIVVLVEEVRVREACGIDATQEPEEVVLRVLEYGGVGGIGVEAGNNLGTGELAG